MNRRSFFGSLAAIIAAPKAWLVNGARLCSFKTQTPPPSGVIARKLYSVNRNGGYTLITTITDPTVDGVGFEDDGRITHLRRG